MEDARTQRMQNERLEQMVIDWKERMLKETGPTIINANELESYWALENRIVANQSRKWKSEAGNEQALAKVSTRKIRSGRQLSLIKKNHRDAWRSLSWRRRTSFHVWALLRDLWRLTKECKGNIYGAAVGAFIVIILTTALAYLT